MSNWFENILRFGRKTADQKIYDEGNPDEPVAVYTAANAMEANLVRALLESEDIPAYTAGAALSDIYGIQVGPLAEVDVYALRRDALQAREIINERHDVGDEELEWIDEEAYAEEGGDAEEV